MGKFITLREEFESETKGENCSDQQYIKWLESIVEKETFLSAKNETYYPLYVSSPEYEKLLVIQSYPKEKVWFKNKEMTTQQFTDLLTKVGWS